MNVDRVNFFRQKFCLAFLLIRCCVDCKKMPDNKFELGKFARVLCLSVSARELGRVAMLSIRRGLGTSQFQNGGRRGMMKFKNCDVFAFHFHFQRRNITNRSDTVLSYHE